MNHKKHFPFFVLHKHIFYLKITMKKFHFVFILLISIELCSFVNGRTPSKQRRQIKSDTSLSIQSVNAAQTHTIISKYSRRIRNTHQSKGSKGSKGKGSTKSPKSKGKGSTKSPKSKGKKSTKSPKAKGKKSTKSPKGDKKEEEGRGAAYQNSGPTIDFTTSSITFSVMAFFFL
jgi:hypothetical protein